MSSSGFSLDDRRVDLEHRLVEGPGDASVRLTWMESRLLAYLFEHDRPVPTEELLTEVWGYAEAAQSRTVATTVRRTRRKIEQDPRAPRHLLTAGPAYQLLCVRRPRPRVAETTRRLPRSLPASHQPRPPLVEDLKVRLAEGAVQLVGAPGVGKSTLLVELAGGESDVAWCELAGCGDGSAVLSVLGRALGLGVADLADDAALLSRIRAVLADRPDLLLVLDHAEDALDSLAHLLPLPVRTVVGTRIAGAEWGTLRVPPLSPPEARAILAPAARGDDEGIARLIDRLGGNPLALTLAAARLRTLTCAQLDGFLARSQEVLASRGGSTRWPSLDAAVQDSWDRLSPGARAALDAAASFSVAFEVEGLETVVGDARVVGVLDGLEELIEHSLAIPQDQGRFTVPGAVRRFVRGRSGRGDTTLGDRHAAFVLDRGEALAARTRERDGLAALRALLLERAELEAALRWTRDRDPDRCARILVCFEPLTWREPVWTHLRTAGDLLAGELSPSVRARLLRFRGTLLDARGRSEEALADFDAVIDGGREVGGDDAVRALVRSVHLVRRSGRVDEAAERADRALAWAQEASYRHLEPDAWVCKGIHALVQGTERDALAHFQRALAGFRVLGDLWGEGILHLNLGIVFRRLGQLDDGLHHQRRAIQILGAWDDRARLANAWGNLGNVLLGAGRFEEAEEAYRAAVDAGRALGSRAREARALNHLSALLLEMGRVDESVELGERCLRMHREVGDTKYELQVITNLTLADLLRGRTREAARRVAEGEALPRGRDAIAPAYHWLCLKALLSHLAGAREDAADWYAQAEGAFAPGGGPRRVELRCWLALLEEEEGRWAQADALLDEAARRAEPEETQLVSIYRSILQKARGEEALLPELPAGTEWAVARLFWERAGHAVPPTETSAP